MHDAKIDEKHNLQKDLAAEKILSEGAASACDNLREQNAELVRRLAGLKGAMVVKKRTVAELRQEFHDRDIMPESVAK